MSSPSLEPVPIAGKRIVFDKVITEYNDFLNEREPRVTINSKYEDKSRVEELEWDVHHQRWNPDEERWTIDREGVWRAKDYFEAHGSPLS